MCERAEDYFSKIRKRQLRFTLDADSVMINDGDKENEALSRYVAKLMTAYDQVKVNEAENELKKDSYEPQVVAGYLKGDPYPRSRYTLAKAKFEIVRNLLRVMDEALTNPTPLIEEGEAFFHELEKCEEEKKSLTAQRDEMTAELRELGAEHIAVKTRLEDCQRKLHIQSLDDKRRKGEGDF